YYFQCCIKGILLTLAVVSVYSPPLPDLLIQSHRTFASCKYLGDSNITIIDATCIKVVVAMIRHSPAGITDDSRYFFLVE
ncbi:hypothetical protein HYPSUDRAFT_150494, partial [Hypholoma sublateritium FD-334 SS-4]